MLDKISKCIKEYKWIIIIGIFISMPMITNRFVAGHDSLYHLANIDALSQAIKDFNFSKIVPTIAGNLGYGGSIFYPKLPHFILAIINLALSVCHLPASIAVNIGYILIILLSGIFMFKLLKILFNNSKISLLGSSLYITMPYFLSEMFVRSALNEATLYIFMPLVFVGLLYLSKQDIKKFYIYFIIGYFGMINSHLVLSVYFTGLILIYLLINIKDYIVKEKIKHLFISAGILLILCIPTFIIMIEHKLSGVYAVFNPEIMGSIAKYVKLNGLNINSYLNMNLITENVIHYFINIIVVLLSIFGFLYLICKEKNKDIKIKMYGFLTIIILSIFMSSKLFPYEYIPKLLLSIQFAYRAEVFVCFSLCIIASYGLKWIINKKRIASLTIAVAISFSCIIAAIIVNGFPFFVNVSWDKYAGMGYQKEYLTMNALNHINYFDKRKNNIKIVSKDKNVKIEKIKDKVPLLTFQVSKLKKNDKVTLELPRLYYLGYKITLTTKDNKKINLDYKNNKYGFIQIIVPQNGYIEIDYTGTVLYQVFKWIRNIFIVTIIVFFIIKKKRKKI